MNRKPRSPTISVITPVYNASQSIQGTLNSLRRQSFADWESILVNDGSTDDSAEKVQPYLDDHRFRYVEQANRGAAAARNTAIESAQGEWICLLDSDDRWMPTKLERQLEFANENKYDIVCTDAVAVQRHSRRLYSQFFTPEFSDKLQRIGTDPRIDVFELLIQHNFLCASSVMLRRSLFDRVGLFDFNAVPAEDYDLWLRCVPDAKLGYLRDPLIEYYIHAGNISHNFTRMVEQTIFVLNKAADRHTSDRRRLSQFEGSLAVAYRTLLTEFLEKRRYASALRHAASLVTRRPTGLHLLYWIIDRGLLTTLRQSFTAKSTRQRSVYGERNLDAVSESDEP